MREYNLYVQKGWFEVSQPNDFELIEGIVISVAVTILLSRELHSVTRRFGKFTIGRLSPLWSHQQP
jgi:hypothetical protein